MRRTIPILICPVWLALLASPAVAAVLAGPITNPSNGHTYYLLDQSSWTAAEAEAASLGGHLVTINDAAENDWVWETFTPQANGDKNLWLGFTDVNSEGTFAWVNGEVVTYTNWAPYEPNNEAGEDYAHMVGAGFQGHSPREWNDILESGLGGGGLVTVPHGVVEISSPPVPTVSILGLLILGIILTGIAAMILLRRRFSETAILFV